MLTCSRPLRVQNNANQTTPFPQPKPSTAMPVAANPPERSNRGDVVDPRKPDIPLEKAYAIGSKLEIKPTAVKSIPSAASFSMRGLT